VQGGVGWSRRSFSEGGTCLAEGEKDYSPLEGGAGGVLARLAVALAEAEGCWLVSP